MIVYGRNAVTEALRGPRKVSKLWLTERLAAGYSDKSVKIELVKQPGMLDKLAGTSAHQGICAEVSEYQYASQDELFKSQSPFILVLDQIQDPQNFGAICRTAECAGLTGVVIPKDRSAEVTPAVCKASAGAVEHLKIAQVTNLSDFLTVAKKKNCWCYGAAAEAEVSYETVDYSGDGVVVVLGSEGSGLRKRVASSCDQLVSLPMLGKIDSLNVSATASVLIYRALNDRTK